MPIAQAYHRIRRTTTGEGGGDGDGGEEGTHTIRYEAKRSDTFACDNPQLIALLIQS